MDLIQIFCSNKPLSSKSQPNRLLDQHFPDWGTTEQALFQETLAGGIK